MKTCTWSFCTKKDLILTLRQLLLERSRRDVCVSLNCSLHLKLRARLARWPQLELMIILEAPTQCTICSTPSWKVTTVVAMTLHVGLPACKLLFYHLTWVSNDKLDCSQLVCLTLHAAAQCHVAWVQASRICNPQERSRCCCHHTHRHQACVHSDRGGASPA